MKEISFENITNFICQQYPGQETIPLHAPLFLGNEKNYLLDTIDSTFVSSVGSYVNRFEEMMSEITGAKYAIAIVNGTSALHMSLILSDVQDGDEVFSQSLTFIATCNAISYIGARPVFIDVDRETLGMSSRALSSYLEKNGEIRKDGYCYNKSSGKRIKACIPMHTFGFPCKIDEIADICNFWNITLIEDAAESLGSYYKGKHTGTFGRIGTFSFNGNKTVTCGGGGALVTNDAEIAKRAKHLTTQAKLPHPWAFLHDDIGYNYRMPNLNAALACAQLEQLSSFIENKRQRADRYKMFFQGSNVEFFNEPSESKSNFWLNALILKNIEEREAFLEYANNRGIMSRPVWELMHRLPMFKDCEFISLENSEWLADRLVNIPSSVRYDE